MTLLSKTEPTLSLLLLVGFCPWVGSFSKAGTPFEFELKVWKPLEALRHLVQGSKLWDLDGVFLFVCFFHIDIYLLFLPPWHLCCCIFLSTQSSLNTLSFSFSQKLFACSEDSSHLSAASPPSPPSTTRLLGEQVERATAACLFLSSWGESGSHWGLNGFWSSNHYKTKNLSSEPQKWSLVVEKDHSDDVDGLTIGILKYAYSSIRINFCFSP